MLLKVFKLGYISRVLAIDCINNGRSIRDITHWFVDCHFEASNLYFDAPSYVLETEVTIFGTECNAEGESRDAR